MPRLNRLSPPLPLRHPRERAPWGSDAAGLVSAPTRWCGAVAKSGRGAGQLPERTLIPP